MEEQKENLWTEFDNLENTDDVVILKAKALYKFLIALNIKSVSAFFEYEKEELEPSLINDKYHELVIDVCIFYLHFIDRMAFESLGPKQRDIFMDILVSESKKALFNIFTELGIDIKEIDFNNTFLYLYVKRQEEYEKFKELVPKNDENMLNTLFWEFGKKVSQILTGKNSNMAINVGVLQFIIEPLVKVLELPKLFGKPKS